MHRHIFPAIAIAGLGLGLALLAVAAAETGTLMNVDPPDARVTLIDGRTFIFPDTPAARAHLAEFKPGEVVAIAADGSAATTWTADAMWLAEPVFGYAAP